MVEYLPIIIKKIMDEQTANPQGEDDAQATPPASGGGEGAQPPVGDQGAAPAGGWCW